MLAIIVVLELPPRESCNEASIVEEILHDILSIMLRDIVSIMHLNHKLQFVSEMIIIIHGTILHHEELVCNTFQVGNPYQQGNIMSAFHAMYRSQAKILFRLSLTKL